VKKVTSWGEVSRSESQAVLGRCEDHRDETMNYRTVVLEGTLNIVESWNAWVGRIPEGHRTIESQNDWVGRVLEGHRTIESQNDCVGRVLEDCRTIESQNGWVGRVLRERRTTEY